MKRFGILIVVVVVLAYASYALLRPIASVQAQPLPITVKPVPGKSISWPRDGQSAVGAIGYGLIGSSGQEKAAPTASIAKVITALAILKRKPITSGQQGPTITLTAADVQLYNDELARNGSSVPVMAGEQITEYQALQAILLPSANNMAVSLSRWAFGSDAAYLDYANKYVAQLGMYHTKVSGASGYEAETISTPSDLVILGEFAMQNPILAEIVGQKEATIPVQGKITNVNGFLNETGYIGIKTGNSDAAGGCYLFAVKQPVEGAQPLVIVGAILGASNLDAAIVQSQALVKSAASQFERTTILKAGQVVGRFATPWGATSNVIAKTDSYAVLQKAQTATVNVQIKESPIGTEDAGTVVVLQKDNRQQFALALDRPLARPSLMWRLSHPF